VVGYAILWPAFAVATLAGEGGGMARQKMGTDCTGMVFDVKRFAIHDGPGIRTTVFLKGCPLTCSWCHNPESQRATPEIFFWASRCVGCGACVAACPSGAVRIVDHVAATDRRSCAGCGRCVSTCPQRARARVGEFRTASDLVAEAERDLLFYDQSGGGVTLSGGEPLAQPEFALAVLGAMKSRRLATALDTCGYAPSEAVAEASSVVDLFLYDLKLMDREQHVAATGVANEVILENARRLDALGARMWIRFPLVPGHTDDTENVRAVGRFVRELRSAEGIQVLPYHRAGEAKRGRLERPHEAAAGLPVPEDLERAAGILRRESGRRVTIGG
jgi:pyruvate formate lyase activating enzyme